MTDDPLAWLAALSLVYWVVGAVETVRGARRIVELQRVAPLAGPDAPPVSVVIAARNEERHLEEALGSVLSQRYPRLEVIVVDDRSTDATGAILDRLAAREPRLRVLHVHELPPGWLGKNHALQRGAETARGEWILFTDADVVMEPSTLARALALASRERLDLLAVAPELQMPGPLLDAFGGTFAMLFAFAMKPWKARDPASPRHIGVGAFNLVRAEAYHAVGGHAPIALRPDDDVKLGKLLKQRGHAQDVAYGRGLVSVEWYASIGEVVHGLEKNSFAALDYSVPRVLAASLALLALNVWPFVALLLTGGTAWLLYAANVLVIVALYAASAWGSGSRPWYAPVFPLTVLLVVFILLRSMVLVLKNQGIRWRDTHYPLAELRRNRI